MLHVDGTSFRDAANRTRIFHGVTAVQNFRHPFLPELEDEDLDGLVEMGMSVVRLGIVLSGILPSPTPNPSYIREVRRLVANAHARGLSTIVVLYQEALGAAPPCGHGTPAWMRNVSLLRARPFPEPLGWSASVNCHNTWSTAPTIAWATAAREPYASDVCARAFGQLYGDSESPVASAVSAAWRALASALRADPLAYPGLLAYEILHAPWVGDHLSEPLLISTSGAAEQGPVGSFMQRAHSELRVADPHTLVLYSPAELTDRLMRTVGYEQGFLDDPLRTAMAFRVSCDIAGTAGGGSPEPSLLSAALCDTSVGVQLSRRDDDLRRLHTAGIVSSWSVDGTHLQQLERTAALLDGATRPHSMPLSWVVGESINGARGVPEFNESTVAEPVLLRRALARSYPRAIGGSLIRFSFDEGTSTLELAYEINGEPHGAVSLEAETTEVVLSRYATLSAAQHQSDRARTRAAALTSLAC